jgi:hypothetical protein
MGGDFNCVLKAADSNEHGSFSRALETLVQGYALSDAWQARPDSNGRKHYNVYGATRIDQIYLSSEALARKMGLATVPAAFTDHLAVVLRLAWKTSIIRRGRGNVETEPRNTDPRTCGRDPATKLETMDATTATIE